MSTQHETPILTRILYVFGAVTIVGAVIGGVVICADSLSEGIAIIIGGVSAGIIYIGIGQAVDYLARTAYSTDRFCTILQTSITERLRAIENSSSAPPVAPTTSPGSKVGYYYSTDGAQQGPVDATDLRMMRKDDLITDDTPVLRDGETQWRRFRDYLALNR
jgi:GYF domain 2